MGYGKRTGFIKITAIVITLVFGLTLFLGVGSAFLGNKNKADGNGVYEDNAVQQQKEEIPVEQPDKAGGAAKYMTISKHGDIDIGVNYLNPVTGDKDNLNFEISIETHSASLTKYKDLTKFVELKTDAGVVISDGFEWTEEKSNDGHHIGGLLKIKNSIAGNPIVGPDTKSFRLVFKNIDGVSEREHVYEGDKLK